MDNNKIVGTLAIIVMLVAISVIIGWFFNIPILTSILPQWVTMKFTTALSFLMSANILYIVSKHKKEESDIAQIILLVSSTTVFLIMGILLLSILMGIRTGIEDLFVQEAEGAVKTTVPGRPSAGTMVNFILIAIAGILAMFNPANLKKYFLGFGWIISVVGVLAILGYIIDVPLFYYTLEGWSTAMAFHTAVLFTLLGIGFIFSGRE